MTRYRTPEEINHYDRFKLLVLLLLLALLAALLLFGEQLGLPTDDVTGVPWANDAVAGEPTVAPQATEVADVGDGSGDATGVLPGALAPILVSPLPGSEVAGGDVVLSGTAEPGTTLRFYVDGALMGETAADAGGNWTIALPLVSGVPAIVIETIGSDGAILNQGGPFSLNVTGAQVPTINEPVVDDDSDTATLSGTGEPGSQVLILVNGQPAGTATVGDDGNWTINIVVPPGELNVQAQALDPGGVVVAQSRTIIVVMPGELAPGITMPGTGSGGEFDPLSGAFTLSGTATPGATVEIVVNGEVVGTTTADGMGNWSFDVSLTGDQNQVQIRVLDEDGNVTGTSDPVDIERPATLPGLALPGLVLPDDTGELQFALPGGPLTWSGTGEPGTQVDVVINDQSAGIVTVDDQGNWTLDLNLEPGQYTLQLFLLDANGNRVSGSTPTDFDVLAMVRPNIETPPGGWAIGPNDLTGTAEPGAELVIYVNDVAVGTTTAGKDGLWAVSVNLPEGQATVRAVMVGDDGGPVFGSVTLESELATAQPSIAEVAASTGQFNTLLAAAQAVGLSETLAQGGPFTVFAPPDTAFAALPAGAVEAWLANPQALSNVLLHHVVPGVFPASDVVAAGTLATAGGTQIVVRTEGDAVLVDNAAVITPDTAAGNGIIHVIDSVMLPPLPAGVAGPVIDDSGVGTFFGSELTVVGTAQPGTLVLVQLNGENFGQLGGADPAGNWLVGGPVSPGQYEIVAYMYDPATNVLLAMSSPVMLMVQ